MNKCLLAFLFITQFCFAQLSQYDWSSVKNIRTTQGLPSNFTDCMLQDSRGFLWFVTNNGTVRYDGMVFKKYEFDIDNANSIEPAWFREILEDKSGIIWIATSTTGLYSLDPVTDKWIHYRNQPGNANSLVDDEIQGMALDTCGKLWIGTCSGLNSFDTKTKKFKLYLHKDGDRTSLCDNYILNLAIDNDFNIWIASSTGFDCINSTNGKAILHFTESPMIDLRIPKEDPLLVQKGIGTNMWLICKNTGVYQYDTKQKKIVRHLHKDAERNDKISTNDVTCLFEDKYRNVWMGMDSDLVISETITGKLIKSSTISESKILMNGFSDVLEDKSGMLWMASGLEGIISIDPKQKQFHVLPDETGDSKAIPSSFMLTLLGLDKNRFIATTENGAFTYDRRTHKITPFLLPYRGRELTREAFIAGSYFDNSGKIFLGTAIRLIVYDTLTKKIQFYEHDINDSSTISEHSCTGIIRDNKNRYWCAVYGGGLNRFYPETGKFKTYKVHPGKNSISTDAVHNTFMDSKENLYLGSTGGGFIQFNPDSESFSIYRHQAGNPETPSNDNVEYFFESKQGYIYFTTMGGGLNVFNPVTKKFRSFTVKDGFASNILSAILEDNHGVIWLGSYAGISSFSSVSDPFDFNCKFQIRNYNISDGLPCNEFMFGGAYKDGDGNLYFGTACGKIVYFNPDDLKDNSYIPPVYITSFSVFNKEVKPSESNNYLKAAIEYTKEIILSYKENVISFTFAALNYVHPENNRYAYMLEGFNKDWIYTDATKRFANYTNLDAGEYIFKVKGSNNDGVWNETPTTIKLFITPPFWETWWFRSALIALVALIIYLLYRFRINEILKLQSIRNRIAYDLHDNIGSTLNSISIYSEVAQNKSKENIPELELIGESSRKVIDAMSDIVWAINPENDSFEKIIFRMRSHVHLLMKAKNIEYIFKADEKLNELTLPMQVRKNFYLIFKEAVNNLLKYSNATRASILLTQTSNKIDLIIRDNGIGFDLNNPPRGNGLNNIKQRATEIHADLIIESEINKGTTVELNFKIK